MDTCNVTCNTCHHYRLCIDVSYPLMRFLLISFEFMLFSEKENSPVAEGRGCHAEFRHHVPIRLWRPPMEQQPYHASPHWSDRASRKPGPQNTKYCGSIAAIATMRALSSISSERGVEGGLWARVRV